MKRKKTSIKETVKELWPAVPKDEIEAAGARVFSRLKEELQKHDTSLRSLYGDHWSVPPVNPQDFQILSAVSQLGGQGSGTDIANTVEKLAPGFNVGYLYAALDRLQKEEFMTARRGNDRQWLYQITEYGERTLKRAEIERKQAVDARAGLDAGECSESSE